MKQKLIHSIKDFLNAILGENETVWHYLESYVNSEGSPSLEQAKPALNTFVDNLNEISVALKNNLNTDKTIFSPHKITDGHTLKSSTHSETGVSVTSTTGTTSTVATKSVCQPSTEDKTVKSCKPDQQSLLKNGPSVSGFNKNLVQIVADKSEIERRIASFIECKRMDVDEENRREFCSDIYPEHGDVDHCARTSAVFVARSGGRSHVEVSRVVNANGPQLRVLSCTPSMSSLPDVKIEPGSMMHNSHLNVAGGGGGGGGGVSIKQEPKDIPSGIEERLKNMEAHLKVTPDSFSNKLEIFERLKALEKRILFLESISPEYFNLQMLSSNVKKRKILSSPLKTTESTDKDLSLVEIDERIKRLRNILQKKQSHLENT